MHEKPAQIERGRIYWVDYAGRSCMVRAREPSALLPGWWTCESMTPGGPDMVPATAFIKPAEEPPPTKEGQ